MVSSTEGKTLEDILRKVGDEDEKDFVLEEEHITFLFRKLHSLAPKWNGFCLQLDVKELGLIQGNATSVDDCLVLGLQSWLRGDSVSWKQLIAAIYRPAGGENQRLAIDVADSFRRMCTFTPIEQARDTSRANICDSYDSVERAVRDLQNMLNAKVAHRWYQMGISLGARVSDMEIIRVGKPKAVEGERMMLDAWLRNCDNTTWQWLVDAVGHVAGGNHQRHAKFLAEKIASRLPSESNEVLASNGTAGYANTAAMPETFSTMPDQDKVIRNLSPDLPTLISFPTLDGYKNLSVEIGPAYMTFGTLLLGDKCGTIMGSLEIQHNRRAADIIQGVFTQWLTEGKTPVTWDYLLKTLRRVGLERVAKLVESGLTTISDPNT